MENTNTSKVIEVPIKAPLREEGAGVMAGGIKGGGDEASLADRMRRVQQQRRTMDYRECVPCDRCGNCQEIRRFTKSGEERVLALYCFVGEMETTPYHTCNNGRRPKNGRKKVIYVLDNAPSRFQIYARQQSEVPFYEEGEKVEPRYPQEGYMGGSKFYLRSGGEAGEADEKKIPKKLMN